MTRVTPYRSRGSAFQHRAQDVQRHTRGRLKDCIGWRESEVSGETGGKVDPAGDAGA